MPEKSKEDPSSDGGETPSAPKMSEVDELFDLRNAYFTGNFQQCIKEAQKIKVFPYDCLKSGQKKAPLKKVFFYVCIFSPFITLLQGNGN